MRKDGSYGGRRSSTPAEMGTSVSPCPQPTAPRRERQHRRSPLLHVLDGLEAGAYIRSRFSST